MRKKEKFQFQTMRYRLYLDTTDRKQKIVKLFKEEKLMYSVSSEESEFELIDKVLVKVGIKFRDIDSIDVNRGPGSFTGLKIGATIANTFNYLKGNIEKWDDLIIPEYGAEPHISKPKKS